MTLAASATFTSPGGTGSATTATTVQLPFAVPDGGVQQRGHQRRRQHRGREPRRWRAELLGPGAGGGDTVAHAGPARHPRRRHHHLAGRRARYAGQHRGERAGGRPSRAPARRLGWSAPATTARPAGSGDDRLHRRHHPGLRPVGFADWWANAGTATSDVLDHDAVPEHTGRGGRTRRCSMYYASVPLQAGKTVRYVTLPRRQRRPGLGPRDARVRPADRELIWSNPDGRSGGPLHAGRPAGRSRFPRVFRSVRSSGE